MDYMDPDDLCITMDERPLRNLLQSWVFGQTEGWVSDSYEIRFQRPWFRILHSAEEDNYSPSESISFPYYQCIKISTNKHVSVLMYVYM